MSVTWAMIASPAMKPPVTAHLAVRRPSQDFFAGVLSFLSLSFWRFPGEKCHYAQEAFLLSPSTVQQTDYSPGKGKVSIIPTSHNWKLIRGYAEGGVSGYEGDHGPALQHSCSPTQCPAQALLLTAFCQLPLRTWRTQELKHTQRPLMGDTKRFMLANTY